MDLKAIETEEILKKKTNRFFDAVLNNNFWDWMLDYYFKDKSDIISDLASFDDINEANKIIELLDELSYILKEFEIKNKIQLKPVLSEIKTTFGYNQVYILKTMIKLLIKYLNIDKEDFVIPEK